MKYRQAAGGTNALDEPAHFRPTRGPSSPFALPGLAVIAAYDGCMQRAGRLWGTAVALASETGFTMGYNRRRYERRLPLHTNAEFSAAVDEGRAITLEQAVAHALVDPTGS